MGNNPLSIWAKSPVTVNAKMGYIPQSVFAGGQVVEAVWIERVRKEMIERGFSMKSLSAAAGQNETFVRDMLARTKAPSVDKLMKVAAVLGVTVAYLVGESEKPDKPSKGVDPEASLRSALLAYGVDMEDIGRAVSAVRVFVDDHDEQSSPGPQRDQSESSSRRRVKAP